MHINLIVFDGSGTELVHAEPLGQARFRLLYSPGFVDGVAAGDEVELMDPSGQFRILRRGGNVAVHLFSETPVGPLRAELEREIPKHLSGTVDGGVERALVLTVPATTGLSVIAKFFDQLVASHPGTTWSFNNVYDAETGQPLGWWLGGA